jgi:hypothetical protein
MVLEVLDGALVTLGGGASGECPEIATFAGSRIGLARIQAIPTGFELSNHDSPPSVPRRATALVASRPVG